MSEIDIYLQKYLKKTGRRQTLEELVKSIKRREQNEHTKISDRKPASLSFTILKPPERKRKKEQNYRQKKTQNRLNEFDEKDKTLKVPKTFLKVAKKFGLPEEHLDFFYENRNSFQWESKDKTEIHCSETLCKFTVKESPGCLTNHMITAHKYADLPCQKPNCSFIAYSQKNLNYHSGIFHGFGKGVNAKSVYPCPYPTCDKMFQWPSMLKTHIDVHENKRYSCNYCQFRCGSKKDLYNHLNIHFDIKKYDCHICPKTFYNKSLLGAHISRTHPNEDFKCVDCDYSSPTRKPFAKHRRICKKRFALD
jgi:uncharacterized Zn-finger protein